MYSQTCLNWSCSKAETLLRRTDTLDPVGFLYAFLSCISKAKNCKGDIASDRYYFQSSAPCLTRTQIKILGISEKQGIKLDIFVNFLKKKHFFYTLKQQFFFDFNLQFWRSATLLTRTRNLFFQVALCKQPAIVFAPLKAISTFKTHCTPLWTIGFSTVTYIKLWWSIKDLQKNALEI